MSAHTSTTLTCDGLHDEGCPHVSVFVSGERAVKIVREDAFFYGWRVRVVGRKLLDVCRLCRMV